jgi:hypothetical protein
MRVFNWKTSLTGALIYLSGDSIAALITGQFSLFRALGILLVGASFYAIEIQTYFAWIEKKMKNLPDRNRKVYKTFLALLYFNPLWIARHMVFIALFSGKLPDMDTQVLWLALTGFVYNIPVSVLANYLIQNVVSLHWRFPASASFSGLMAIYYSLIPVLFA